MGAIKKLDYLRFKDLELFVLFSISPGKKVPINMIYQTSFSSVTNRDMQSIYQHHSLKVLIRDMQSIIHKCHDGIGLE